MLSVGKTFQHILYRIVALLIYLAIGLQRTMILMVMVYYNLQAERDAIIRDCVAGDDLYLRGESAYHHGHLKRVKITGFHSAKSLIKLVIHILESVPSLEALMLDTTRGCGRKPGDISKCTASGESDKCCWISERDLKDTNGAVEAAGRYIVGRVPSAVAFEVLEPCRRCYTGNR
jgi:hypothetical protein